MVIGCWYYTKSPVSNFQFYFSISRCFKWIFGFCVFCYFSFDPHVNEKKPLQSTRKLTTTDLNLILLMKNSVINFDPFSFLILCKAYYWRCMSDITVVFKNWKKIKV